MLQIDQKKQNIFTKIFSTIKNKLKIIAINDIVINEGLIYCGYELFIASRMHHLYLNNKHKLPTDIINSFAFKYFSSEEQKFLLGCNEYNNIILFLKNNSNYNFERIYSGTEVLIVISYANKVLKFKIGNLDYFINVFKKYRTQLEAEQIINLIFRG
ncbi:hypothetical protein ACFX5K_03475 [Rickettsiales bacterium LUAb2]